MGRGEETSKFELVIWLCFKVEVVNRTVVEEKDLIPESYGEMKLLLINAVEGGSLLKKNTERRVQLLDCPAQELPHRIRLAETSVWEDVLSDGGWTGCAWARCFWEPHLEDAGPRSKDMSSGSFQSPELHSIDQDYLASSYRHLLPWGSSHLFKWKLNNSDANSLPRWYLRASDFATWKKLATCQCNSWYFL